MKLPGGTAHPRGHSRWHTIPSVPNYHKRHHHDKMTGPIPHLIIAFIHYGAGLHPVAGLEGRAGGGGGRRDRIAVCLFNIIS